MDKDMMKSLNNNNFNKADIIQSKSDMIKPIPDKNNHFNKADMMQQEFIVYEHEGEQIVKRR